MSKATSAPREKLDPARWLLLKDILADALEQATPAARTALVAQRCANDETLRLEAASLVREAEAFLREPTDSFEDIAEQATVALWEEEAARAGWRIGAYVVTRELGRGGMGAVYLAQRADGQFEKEVAIKVLKRGTDTEEVLRRFAAERHILARLDHPNIAHLLDAGTTDDGLPYVVMEYVAGLPVNRYIREHDLSVAERLGIFLKICAAVEVAHHNHVIHRDLKPGNILVNAEGEPKLLDFGIAKLLGPGNDCLELTAAGEVRLTPNCASPEQTDGRPVTGASDVYALGALLYEMLCGKKPHKFSSAHPPREEIVRVIREEEPAWPSTVAEPPEVARQLRGDLDAIVLYALRKEPEMRYPTVMEFAADVRRHLAHEPVQARRGSAGYRARSFLVRHRRGLRATAAAVGLLVLVLAFFWSRSASHPSSPAALTPKSIAVLPFDNLGDKQSSSYFADSIQDNILTDLAKVDDLKVISRSGVAAYRGGKKSVREIGRELGVAHVLEGSVQTVGNRVRVNAQLIDAQSDTQEWAEQYDRQLQDIFSLQSELAQTIAGQLRARLSSREKAAIWQRPTEDPQAYDLFLRARAIFNKTGLDDATPLWNQAIQLANEAVARDPNFVLAYCLLNDLHLFKYRFGVEHAPADLEAAKNAAETALRLQPESSEARVAMARYYYHGLSDYRRTLEELARVPGGVHEAEFYILASLAERRLGLWTDSLRDGAKAIELDPNNVGIITSLMQTTTGVRRFDETIHQVDAAVLRLPAEKQSRIWILKQEALLGKGDLPGAEAALQNVTPKDGMDYQVAQLWLLFMKRDYTGAQALMERASEEDKTLPGFWLAAGSSARGRGDTAKAEEYFQKANQLMRARLQTRPNDPDLLCSIGVAEAGLGHKEEALRLAQRGYDLVPPGVDALVSPACGSMLAQVLAWNGDREGTLNLLAKLVRMPFGPNYGDLRYSPYWDDLRNDPRFDQLLAATTEPIQL